VPEALAVVVEAGPAPGLDVAPGPVRGADACLGVEGLVLFDGFAECVEVSGAVVGVEVFVPAAVDEFVARGAEEVAEGLVDEIEPAVGVLEPDDQGQVVDEGADEGFAVDEGLAGVDAVGDVDGRGADVGDAAVVVLDGDELEVDPDALAVGDGGLGFESGGRAVGGVAEGGGDAVAEVGVVGPPEGVGEGLVDDVLGGERGDLEGGPVDLDEDAVGGAEADEGEERIEDASAEPVAEFVRIGGGVCGVDARARGRPARGSEPGFVAEAWLMCWRKVSPTRRSTAILKQCPSPIH